MVAILVAAENATVEPNEGIARRNDRVAASQTVRMGDWKRASTLVKKWGNPPSLEKPNIMRELDVMENKPACQTHKMTRVMRARAPLLPKMSMRIWMTGWPAAESTVLGKSWMEKRREMRRKKPKTEEQPTEVRTPRGAFQAAFWVSSERWAEASGYHE